MSFKELPDELLALIFEDFIRTEGHVKFLKNVVPVCKTWRDIGLSFPSLCKTVDIAGVKDMTQRYLPEPVLASLRWGLPVTTELKISKVWLNQKISEELFPGCPNLKSLTVSDCRIHATTFAIVTQHCKKLESIVLDSVNQNGTTISRSTLEPIFLQSGPNLRSVSMSNPKFFNNILECGEVVATILDSCPRLEQLKISTPSNKRLRGYIYFDISTFPVEKLRTCCPKLRVLSVEGYRFDDLYSKWKTEALRNLEQIELISVLDVRDFLNVFRNAKQLKQLTMKDVDVYYVGDNAIHLNFGSECLENLHLVDVSFEPTDFQELLARYRHSLKELTLVDEWWADQALLALTWGNGKSPHKDCTSQEQEPSLEVLNLSIPDIEILVVAEVVRECKELRTVDISGCLGLPECFRRKFDTVEEINLLRDSLPRVTDDDSDSE